MSVVVSVNEVLCSSRHPFFCHCSLFYLTVCDATSAWLSGINPLLSVFLAPYVQKVWPRTMTGIIVTVIVIRLWLCSHSMLMIIWVHLPVITDLLSCRSPAVMLFLAAAHLCSQIQTLQRTSWIQTEPKAWAASQHIGLHCARHRNCSYC